MGKKIQYIGRYVMDGQTLGKGSFARVELATHGVTKCKVAIKIIDTRKITEDYVRSNLYREARILAQMRHPNIIRLYETLKATTLYCLVTEYAAGGELLEYLKTFKDQRLTEAQARPYVRQLISALHYLHERNVVHRDLKMENIMLNESRKCIKIVDFGLSNSFSKGQLLKTHCGSPEYAAPELFTTGKEYGCEIDIWSLGVIMYALVVGKLPFTTPYTDQYRRAKLLQQIQKGLIQRHDREMQLLSTDCRNLLRQLIEPNPELRLPLQEIEAHPWVTKNGQSPFKPYTVTPRDKVAKQQIVSELSEALDMPKENVEKQVKENASDELSAMYNMRMDERREQEGWFNKDHTYKAPPVKPQTSKCKDRTCPSNDDLKRTILQQNHAASSKKPVKNSRGKMLVKQATRSCVTNPDLNTRGKKSIPDTAKFGIPPPLVIRDGYSNPEPSSSKLETRGESRVSSRGLAEISVCKPREREILRTLVDVDESQKSDQACALDTPDTVACGRILDTPDTVPFSRGSGDLYGESLNSGISQQFMSTPDEPSPVATIFEKYPINRDSLPAITPEHLTKRGAPLKRPQRLSLNADFTSMRNQLIRANRASQSRLESYALAMAATKKPRVPSPSKIPAPSPLREMKSGFCSYVPYKICTPLETPPRPSTSTPARPTRIPSPIKPVKSPAGNFTARTSLLLKLARARGAIPDYLDYTQAPRALPEDDACSCNGSDFNPEEFTMQPSTMPGSCAHASCASCDQDGDDLALAREAPANKPSQFCLLASDPELVESNYLHDVTLDNGARQTVECVETLVDSGGSEISHPDSGLLNKPKSRTRLGGILSALYSKLDSSNVTSDEGAASDQSTSRLVKREKGKKRKLFRGRGSKDQAEGPMQSGPSEEDVLCMRSVENQKSGLPGNGVLPTAVHGADLACDFTLPHGTSFGSLSAGSGARVHPTSRESDEDIVPNSTGGGNGGKNNHSTSSRLPDSSGALSADNGPVQEAASIAGNGPNAKAKDPSPIFASPSKPYSMERKQTRWKQGLSHLLRRSKSSTNNNLASASPKSTPAKLDDSQADSSKEETWNSGPNTSSPAHKVKKPGLRFRMRSTEKSPMYTQDVHCTG